MGRSETCSFQLTVKTQGLHDPKLVESLKLAYSNIVELDDHAVSWAGIFVMT